MEFGWKRIEILYDGTYYLMRGTWYLVLEIIDWFLSDLHWLK
jgi:hypothetical protein